MSTVSYHCYNRRTIISECKTGAVTRPVTSQRRKIKAAGLCAVFCVFALSTLPLLLSTGCGVKGAPIPPDMAKPATIRDLQAAADPGGINLSWSRPTRYAGGHNMRDLGYFVIMRAEPNRPFEPLVEIPLSDQERFSPQNEFDYMDGETQIGRNYRYEIVSRTVDGYSSAPSNEVDFTRVRPSKGNGLGNFTLPTPKPLPTNVP